MLCPGSILCYGVKVCVYHSVCLLITTFEKNGVDFNADQTWYEDHATRGRPGLALFNFLLLIIAAW
jgi:hypothetical protein